MTGSEFRIKFWGVRGSLPVPGTETIEIGGNTSCIEVNDGRSTILIDAGTGFRVFGNSIMNTNINHITLFFSHYHWDHLQGFSFFSPLHKPDFSIDAYGEPKVYGSTEDIISGQMTHPYFPVTISDLPGKVKFYSIKKGETLSIGNFEIKAIRLRHPDGCLGFKFTKNGKSFMYGTDYEHLENQEDNYYIDEIRGIDCLIHDSTYTDDELAGIVGPCRKGWGHSTWQKGCEIAIKAGIKQLILTHHEINRADEMVMAIEKAAKKVFPSTIAAYEGLEIEI